MVYYFFPENVGPSAKIFTDLSNVKAISITGLGGL
jgi:hypothetical protein